MPSPILLVDDDPDLLSGLRTALRRRYEVRTAQGASAGLEILAREGPFSVVVSDYRMPGMNGVEFLERVREIEPRIVRLMLTGQGDATTTIEAVNRGNIFRLLTKPCSQQTLRTALDAALDQFAMIEAQETHQREIEHQNARYDALLHALFPESVVAELRRTGRFAPRRHEDVAVLFCDITGFTPYCEKREPEDVVRSLEELVEGFEDVCLQHEIEKTKTIGDAFMATAGLLRSVENPILNCVRAGLAMIEVAREVGDGWDVRVGVHVGPVVAGVMGRRQYLFDVWGDTVNTAARVEHEGRVGGVTVTEAAWRRIADRASGHSLGCVDIRGKGELELFAVDAVDA